MPYTQQQWHDDTTSAPYGPINGARLNYIEAGIGTAQTTAEAALAAAGGGGTAAGIGTALPLVDGTASAGSGTLASAVNHVHPTDTSRAPLASPTFTGSPVLPTGTTAVTQSPGNNSTKIATTAYADAIAAGAGGVSLGSATPIVDGTAAAGTASTASHQDHVHPTDTSRAALASPTFSGTPSMPTGTIAVTQSAADSSTKLATTAFVTTADNLKANLASPTFSGTPSLPTGTTAVTQSAGDNSTKLATTAYADVAGGGAAGQAETYRITTNGTAMTAYTSTGSVAATNTDVGTLVTGLAASRTSFVFGTGVFPWTTKIVLDGLVGVSLRGQGGRQDDNKGAVGGAGATQFKWTPGSGQAFTAAGAQGLTLDGIAFQWSSSSYVSGDGTKDGLAFMSIEGVDHNTPTRHALIKNCYLGAVSGGKLDTGGPILDVNKTVNIEIRDSLFVGGTMHLRSHHVNSTDDFANVFSIIGCRFSRHKAPTSAATGWPSFYGSGEAWTFQDCHWEPSQGNTQYLHETQIDVFGGLRYIDCWVGDQGGGPNTTTSALITFHGAGLTIDGGHWSLNGGYSFFKTNGVTTGVTITGIDVDSANDSGTNGWIQMPSNSALDVTVESVGIYPTTLMSGVTAQPPRTGQVPYKALSATTTLAQSDHDRVFGVDASAGAITITLPAASCVGCKLSVKKIDSSGNAVTVSRASSALIDGATTVSLSAQYAAVSLISNGTNWQVIGGAPTGGGGGGAPSGAAGGSLTGTYPNPTIASIPSGAAATTQTATTNDTTIATTAYVMAKERAFVLGKAGAIGATETDASDMFFIVPFDCTLLRMKAVVKSSVSGAMTVQLRKATTPSNSITWADVSGFVCTYTGSGYYVATIDPSNVNASEGDLLGFSCATGSGTDLLVEVVAVLR